MEEECVLQLEGYKEADIRLKSYSVLVPKTDAGIYYGSSSGTDYYYNYISVADYDRKINGRLKGSSNDVDWGRWVSGAVNVLTSFAHYSVSIPFSIISSIVGIVDNSEINYGAYNHYVAIYNNVMTKMIYRGSPTFVAAINFRAEKGNSQVQLFFCPVKIGQPAYIFIEVVFDEYIDLTETFTKEYLLGYFTYTNITGEIVDLPLNSLNITEAWG